MFLMNLTWTLVIHVQRLYLFQQISVVLMCHHIDTSLRDFSSVYVMYIFETFTP